MLAFKGMLFQVRDWIEYNEIEDVSTPIELKFWKAAIDETGAESANEREACRVQVPGPVRELILLFLGKSQ